MSEHVYAWERVASVVAEQEDRWPLPQTAMVAVGSSALLWFGLIQGVFWLIG